MTTTRTAMNKHPLVEAYLADLDRALRGSDPRERAETLASITEHLDEALGNAPSTDAVRQVLAELGPVDAIAASTTPAEPHHAAQPPRWLPALSLAMAGASLALLLLNPFIALPLALAALVMGIVQLRSDASSRPLTWAAVAVSTATILGAVILAILLLSVSQDDDPVPSPRESVQQR
ncbi:hypothetical protein GCM10011331_11980 [Flavimobilis marinus]|uniref:Uncharacterized membrane protein n=1 Tax=Flavimobilis marinus TaxID=285351 RepID=A0A1I2I0W7_9MICO|nr:hypothetical protein [Flavimobilis marinus]GHG49428.1 hypothetical protein GCM10011331_11980 [Flavimobilis marinus]SFF34171.1 Uncharacterized membrane protein [Flavimobilis marinus]